MSKEPFESGTVEKVSMSRLALIAGYRCDATGIRQQYDKSTRAYQSASQRLFILVSGMLDRKLVNRGGNETVVQERIQISLTAF